MRVLKNVEVLAEWTGQYWKLTVPSCPYCGKKHWHGGGNGSEPDAGHRHTHCLRPTPEAHVGYVLIVSKKEGVNVQQRRQARTSFGAEVLRRANLISEGEL